MMHQLETAIYVDDFIISHEYDLLYGSKKSEAVGFSYYNTKKEIESTIRPMTYSKAVSLARERRNDLRYRNYQYLITQYNQN